MENHFMVTSIGKSFYGPLNRNDYRLMKKGNIKYSYDYNQIFTNKSNLGIKNAIWGWYAI